MPTDTTILSAERQDVKQNLTQLLRQEVEETFGKKIVTSRDCIQLSEEIYFKAGSRINSNTLRRFYGLVKAEYPASLSTLAILSKYCGFSNMDQIAQSRKKQGGVSAADVEAGIHDYLLSLFKATSVRDLNDETYLTMVRHTIQFLCKHPEFADRFQRAIAKTRNGQDFYFEQFVHMDRLNDFYGEGLRYYLNETREDDAVLFANSILCLRAWLNGDAADIKKYFGEVKKIRLLRTAHPLLAGRYFSAHLYYASLQGLNTDGILMEAQNTHASLTPARDHYRQFPCFEYTFGMALLLTRHFNEALFYTDYAMKHYSEQHHYLDKGFYRTLDLLRALTLAQCGHRREAEVIYQRIRPSQFYFLSKKTNTILYAALGHQLNKSNPQMVNQGLELIKETGFKQLASLLP